MIRLRSVVSAALVAAAALAISPAGAQPSAEDRKRAETLFNEARAHVDRGELGLACDKFAQSQKLDPAVGTLLYLATCHEQTGKTATAHRVFTEARAAAEAAGKPERVTQATEGIARVEAVLSKVKITLTEPAPSQTVRINGTEVSSLDAAIALDPGTLTIESEAPGRRKHTQTVELGVGPVELAVTIPKLEGDQAVAPKPTAETDHTIAYIVGGSGIGLTLVGLGLGGGAWAASDAADEHCDGTLCTQEGLDGHETANSLAWASNVLFFTGLAAVGTGVILYFVLPSEEKPADKTASAVPYFDAGFGNLELGVRGTFQ